MKKAAYGIAAFSLVLATAVSAQAPVETPAQNPAMNPGSKSATIQFSAADANKDGKVSKDEVKSQADLTSAFDRLDANHDTYLSESEFSKWSSSPTPGAAQPRKDAAPQSSDASPN
ncbi:MAG: EF-hand domain-containing protein [Pseudomonadota bacterium]